MLSFSILRQNRTILYKYLKKLSSLHFLRLRSTVLKENEAEYIFDYDDIGHVPVMPHEIVRDLNPQNNQVFLDMTFGAGGHSRHLLNAASIKLYCLDRDPIAYQKALQLAEESNGRVSPLLGKFSEMKTLFEQHGILPNSLDGIVLDAGCSSMQMDTAERGFSISKNGALDMRMDGSRYPDQPTAADVINTLDIPSLARIFKVYGEEKHSRKIAQALFDSRYMLKTINTTHELADVIQSTLGCEQRFDRLRRSAHVATKVFQAVRIFVNDELNELHYGLEMAHRYLRPGGRLAVLSFHSLEDRIAKRQILGVDLEEPFSKDLIQKYKSCFSWHSPEHMDQVMGCKKWRSLHKHVVTPSREEMQANPRSRSAKLRVAEKVAIPESTL